MSSFSENSGRLDLLHRLHGLIAEGAGGAPAATKTIVYLSNYIDRGLDSQRVIDCLLDETPKGLTAIYLMGNHEEVFLQFLDDAAGATCAGWIEMEGSQFHSIDDPSSMEKADVRNNIEGLRWKIQGKSRDSVDPIIDDYETLFVKVHQRTDSTDIAWTTVCVAMFTHPDFFMY